MVAAGREGVCDGGTSSSPSVANTEDITSGLPIFRLERKREKVNPSTVMVPPPLCVCVCVPSPNSRDAVSRCSEDSHGLFQ